jgi:hypothetical protein
MSDRNHCWTCGAPRGFAPLRGSWGIHLSPWVPRNGDPDHRPAQSSNDILCGVSVYRNGGTNSETHLCDACLAIAARAVLVELRRLLSEESEDDKDRTIAELTERLARTQYRLHSACFEHNRMQARLAEVLPEARDDEPEAVRMARWEVARGRLKGDYS